MNSNRKNKRKFIAMTLTSLIIGSFLLPTSAFASTVNRETQMFIDGNRIANIIVKDGTSYVGVRDLAHYIGYNVEYNAIDSTINMYKMNGTGETDATTTKPTIKRESNLFPTQVSDIDNGNGIEIVKIYELSPTENPLDISRDSFEQNGFNYTLTDITKNENSSISKADHTETVTINTASKDVNAILGELQKEMEFATPDGYTGTLVLDVSTIKSDVAGYKNSSYTSSETREYPNLSSQDTSLVPKTIQVNGKTLHFASVTWKSTNDTAVDYTPLSDTYKAVATYTATGTKTTVAGYVTTAEYKGNLSKVVSGKTIYTAYFKGESITPPPVKEFTAQELEQMLATQQAKEKALEEAQNPNKNSGFKVDPLMIGVCLMLLAMLGTGGYLFFLRKNVVVENMVDGKYKIIGKVRVSRKIPIIDLTEFTARVVNASFILTIDQFTAKRLRGETITINYGADTTQSSIAYDDGTLDKRGYKIDVDF